MAEPARKDPIQYPESPAADFISAHSAIDALRFFLEERQRYYEVLAATLKDAGDDQGSVQAARTALETSLGQTSLAVLRGMANHDRDTRPNDESLAIRYAQVTE